MAIASAPFPRSRASFELRVASPKDAGRVAPLFDAYRVYYGQKSDPKRARRFLRERLMRAESVVLLAETKAGTVLGFAQLYPSFSSLSAARILVLNDLFVAPESRGCGIGSALLEEAVRLGRRTRAIRLTLETGVANLGAQKLYEAHGWEKVEDYFHYEREIG